MNFIRFVLPGMAMIAVTYGFARFGYGLLLPEFSRNLGLDTVTSGIIASGSYFSYCMAIVLSTFMTSRLGPRIVIIMAGLTACLGMFTMAISHHPGMFALGVWMAGASTGLASPPYAAVVSQKISKGLQERANTWINSGTGLGIIISGPTALFFAGHWRIAYILFALLALLVLFWNAVVLPAEEKGKREKVSYSSFIRKGLLPLFLASLIIGTASASYWTFSRGYLVHEGQHSDWVTSGFWIVIGISGILGGIAGNIIQQIGLFRSYRFGVFTLALSILLLPVFLENVLFVYLSAFLFGVAYIYLTGVLLVWGIRVFPKQTATGIGLPFLTLALGQVIGSPTAGMVADRWDFSFMFILFAVAGTMGTLIKPSK
ncbi:MFS transporter [Desmospora profundinema]|uniref:MFS family arabinose efflux permease n=1 Tax=Desmospora profundinema TaxID=1571184 RepID=A0ABU1ILZ3_9BACL|nr:MFS transporter [Desmospora profundinema]MDR6225711.1 putative MFS family arabinose efflux permease [Desmospora profundinema]